MIQNHKCDMRIKNLATEMCNANGDQPIFSHARGLVRDIRDILWTVVGVWLEVQGGVVETCSEVGCQLYTSSLIGG